MKQEFLGSDNVSLLSLDDSGFSPQCVYSSVAGPHSMSSSSSSSSSELSLPRICVRLNWTAWWWCASLRYSKKQGSKLLHSLRQAIIWNPKRADNTYTMNWGPFFSSGWAGESAERACNRRQEPFHTRIPHNSLTMTVWTQTLITTNGTTNVSYTEIVWWSGF